MLSATQRQILLEVARQAITTALDGKRLDQETEVMDEALRKPSGAFVTLTVDDGLRGCVGSIEPVAGLAQAVASSAVNAAFRDPRFFPITREELGKIHLEISVMGPIERVENVEDIVVGRDGLIITSGSRAGLLLPQVASEHGWDRETFLSQTCVKAGLPPSCWKSGQCRIEKFSAEVFGEPSHVAG